MIHVKIGGDGHVEFIKDQVFNKMPGQFGMPLHDRHLAWAPALVGWLKLFGYPIMKVE